MMKMTCWLAVWLLMGCATQVSGLHPLYPSAANGRVNVRNPTLQWEPLPWSGDAEVSDIRYDLKVLLSDGTPFYSREGLLTSEHTMEAPLEPGVAYVWTVRARFRWNGERRLTQWSRIWNPLGRESLTPEPAQAYLPLRTSSNR